MPRYAQYVAKKWYAQYLSIMCPRHAQDMPNVCPKYTQDMAMICQSNIKRVGAKCIAAKCPLVLQKLGENVLRQNVLGAKCQWGKMSLGQNVLKPELTFIV